MLTTSVLTFIFQKELLGKPSPSLLQKAVLRGPWWGGHSCLPGDSSGRNTKRCPDKAHSIHHHEGWGLFYLILYHTTLCGWDYFHFTGEETEAESDACFAKAGKLAALGFELTPW